MSIEPAITRFAEFAVAVFKFFLTSPIVLQ